MTKLTQEQIDNYHAGKMSESEMTDFERMLESDPAIKAESDFQSDIVNGLKEYRKLELKSRLDAINVGPTWIEFAQQSALMKSLGGVIVASLIGTGIYIYGERPEKEIADIPATVEASKVESIEFIWELGQEQQKVTSAELDRPEKMEKTQPSPVENEQVVIASNDTQETESTPVPEEKTEEVFKPTFEAPNAESVDDESLATTGLDEIPVSAEGKSTEEPIDVQSEISKSNTIKYKYYDGKLFLKGDFDKAPYEILEINSASGRRIYVYYLDNYYKVNNVDKLTQLPKVTNSDVIAELKLLRENK